MDGRWTCKEAGSPGAGSEILDGFGCGLEDRGVSRKAKVIVIGEGEWGEIGGEGSLGMIFGSALIFVDNVVEERWGGRVHVALSVANKGG